MVRRLSCMDNYARRKQLGESIRRCRERRDLSQRELALMISSNQSYLWEIEQGKTSVGFDVICRIADALDIAVRDLVDF